MQPINAFPKNCARWQANIFPNGGGEPVEPTAMTDNTHNFWRDLERNTRPNLRLFRNLLSPDQVEMVLCVWRKKWSNELI